MVKKIVSLFVMLLILGGAIYLNETSPIWDSYQLVSVSPDEAVKPKKTEYSAEDQAILDEYYRAMLEKFPQTRSISREMLLEYITRHGEYVSVEFTFCLGGKATDCRFRFDSSDFDPEGRWRCQENDFSIFYSYCISKRQMDEIRSLLAAQIREKIAEYKLEERDPVEECLSLFWSNQDGEPCALAEYIAYFTSETVGLSPCGDLSDPHYHVFASLPLR